MDAGNAKSEWNILNAHLTVEIIIFSVGAEQKTI